MPVVEINYVAVLVSAIAGMAIGSIWYAPAFLGNIWMKEVKLSKESMAAAKKEGMLLPMLGMFAAELVMAYVLAHIIVFAGATTALAGMIGGFWCWLGFVAMPGVGTCIFERKSITYFAINSGHYLMALLAMGAILASWY